MMNSTLRRPPQLRILGDSWYAASIEDFCETLDGKILANYPGFIKKFVKSPGLLRALFMFWYGRSYDILVTSQRLPGTWILILLEALLGRNRLVLLEFMPAPIEGNWKTRIERTTQHFLIIKLMLPYALRVAHVLTEVERKLYSEKYNLPVNKIFCIPWPLKKETDISPDFDTHRPHTVVSSGRMFCDWDTLLKAADGMGWDLVLICAAHEYTKLKLLGDRFRVKVLTNVSIESHQELLSNASVYVISLHEAQISSGQIRVMNAIRCGVPIVATTVMGLEGYLENGQTALLVEPGDWSGMRQAVNRLLSDSSLARRIASQAWKSAEGRTFENYLGQLKSAVHGLLKTDAPVN